MVDALLSIIHKVGVRAVNLPDEKAFAVLIHHVVVNYGGHTLKEIQLAFDMAIAGQLDVEANCYENFSCLYFSTIMNKYREWAAQAYRQNESVNPLQIEDKEDTSDAAMKDWMDYTRTQNLSVEFMPTMLYDWLDRKGMITISNAKKKEYLARAVSYRQIKLVERYNEAITKDNFEALKVFNEMKDSGCFEGSEIKSLKELAKKMVLYDYLIETTV